MKGEKIDLVVETIKFVAKQLKETDRFALVTYDTNVTVDMSLKELTTDARAILEQKVRLIEVSKRFSPLSPNQRGSLGNFRRPVYFWSELMFKDERTEGRVLHQSERRPHGRYRATPQAQHES